MGEPKVIRTVIPGTTSHDPSAPKVRPRWIVHRAKSVVVGIEPVLAPLGGITSQVIQTKRIGGKCCHRCRLNATQRHALWVDGNVAKVGSAGEGSTGVTCAVSCRGAASAGGKFPFGFGRQPFSSPAGIGHGIVPGNGHDWMLFASRRGVKCPPSLTLVAGSQDETPELGVCHLCLVEKKRRYSGEIAAAGLILANECPTGNVHHAGRWQPYVVRRFDGPDLAGRQPKTKDKEPEAKTFLSVVAGSAGDVTNGSLPSSVS